MKTQWPLMCGERAIVTRLKEKNNMRQLRTLGIWKKNFLAFLAHFPGNFIPFNILVSSIGELDSILRADFANRIASQVRPTYI